MTASRTTFLLKHAMMTCVCVLVMLVISLAAGSPTSAHASTTVPAAHHVASAVDSHPMPHRSCPLSTSSQGAGACSFAGSIAMAQPADSHTVLAEPKSSRVAATSESVAAEFLGSRLERPPRV
jgi:hypothetical protein